MKTLIDARLLQKAMNTMVASSSKNTTIAALMGRNPWGDEPGDMDTITLMAMEHGVAVATQIPVENNTRTQPFLIEHANAKLVASICGEALKAHKKSDDQQEKCFMVVSFTDNTMSVIPDLPKTSGVIVNIISDMEENTFSVPGVRKLITEGGADTMTRDGESVTSDALMVVDGVQLGVLSRISKTNEGFPLKWYHSGHMATPHRVSCGVNNAEAGTIMVSAAIKPQAWGDGEDIHQPADMVEFPADGGVL